MVVAERERTPARLVLAGLMLVTFLVAIDSSIVSTAMPTITGILQGFELYSWVFSIYLLTSTVTVPIYGKLADLYGRKRILLFGIAVFLAGSVLCGLAQNMLQLVIFRGVQGIGGGAVLPISVTILGDLYDVEERAKVQGWVGSVWGVSAVAGPALGGLIVDNTSWRWIFLINVPVGALALATIVLFFHEDLHPSRHSIDYPGAVALMAGAGALLLALTSGGREWAWLSPESLLIFAASALTLAAFLAIERRSAEPVLPLSLFRNRMIAVAGLAGFLVGGVLVGTVTYVPLFAQGALGVSATLAGGVMATMSLGWPLAGSFSGRLIKRRGYRVTALLGGGLLVLGTAMLLLLSSVTSPAYVALCSFVIGAGLGFSSTAFIVGIQDEVEWRQRGVATSSYLFLRSLGGAIFVAALGSVLNNSLSAGTGLLSRPASPPQRPLDLINSLLDPAQASGLPSEALATVRQALAQAVHSAFLWQVVAAVVALVVVARMPRHKTAE